MTMNTTYRTIIVKFKKPIVELDGIFSDVQSWGASSLKNGLTDMKAPVSHRLTPIRQSSQVSTIWRV